jgi:PAS domain S-box-containing protein
MKKTKSNPDPSQLRVLILENDIAAAKLIERELRRGGIIFTSRLVKGKREYSKALADFQPQIILSDFKLPKFDSLAALEIARQLAPDVPFIFVSESIGEEKAIEMLAHGAADYIFKYNLQRLGPVVKRVVKETHLKLEKKNIDEELRRHVDELRLLAEAADRFVNINDLDEVYDYLDRTIRDISGADYLLLSLYDKELQAVRPKIAAGFEPFRETINRRFHIDLLQMVFYLKDMRKDDFSDFVSRQLLPVRDGLYGLSNRKIPRSVCRIIEKLLAIGSMYTMGFSWENQLFGRLMVFFKKGNELKNASQIEALLNQSAVTIKRLLAEKSLSESEKKYRTLVETSPDVIIIVDADVRITFASTKAHEIFGIPDQNAIIGISILDFVEPGDIPMVQERLVEILSGRLLPEVREYRLLRHDRRPFWGEISSAPLRDATGRSSGLLLICRDVSERRVAEEHIQYQASLLQHVSDAIIATNNNREILMWNQAAENIYGWKAEEVIGKKLRPIINPKYLFQSREEAFKTLKEFGIWSGEIIHYHRNGNPLTIQSSISILKDTAGNEAGMVSVNHDISESKQAEEKIRTSLNEKEVLLQEIHHRVKNNLQIISGLLTLQANQASGKPLDEIFRECQDRIHSIALIHEKLYCSRNLAEIAFDEYIRALTENLFTSHGVAAGRITVKYEMESVFFTIEKAIPLGLIANELVSNALKHAFPNERQGEIRIELHERREKSRLISADNMDKPRRASTYELAVENNGVILPAGFNADTQKTIVLIPRTRFCIRFLGMIKIENEKS